MLTILLWLILSQQNSCPVYERDLKY